MPPKPRSADLIASETLEQSQRRRASIFSSSYQPVTVPARVRTSHACERCRELRAKCTGGIRCVKCTRDDAICSYSDRKREREKKDIAVNLQRIYDLQNDKSALLAALRSVVEAPNFQSARHPDAVGLVRKMAGHLPEGSQKFGHSVSHGQRNSSSRSQRTEDSPTAIEALEIMSNAGESLAGSDIGSPDRQRELGSAVDLDQGMGMPGYVGKMSDISWMQRIRQYLIGITPLAEPDLGLPDVNDQDLETITLSYFTEDHDFLDVDEFHVDTLSVPSWQVAQVLIEAYFHSIQGAFCFIEQEHLLRALRYIYDHATIMTALDWSQRRTLALANVVWAIGAKWMEMTRFDQHLSQENTGAPLVENHLVYYARARSLGLDHRIQVDHPTLETVQGMAILSFYLLSNGSIHKFVPARLDDVPRLTASRAWSLMAHTIRHATAFGLHLKVLPDVLSKTELRRRASLWWSLFRMETSLSEITGRPKCINETDVTISHTLVVPEVKGIDEISVRTEESLVTNSFELWQHVAGGSSRVGESWGGGVVPWSQLVPVGLPISESHFKAALELSRISYKVGSVLYLRPADISWADIQSTVRDLEADLARWQEDLHDALRMDNIGKGDIDPRSNLDLELNLCSVRMILYRPFMCEIQLKDESPESIRFNSLSARSGVTAAIRVTEIMPDSPVAAQVSQIFPWWTLLHYISQATAMLCLELCLNVQHMQEETQRVMAALRKALNYLWVLAPGSKSAYRAWHIYRWLVDKVAQRYRHSIFLTDISLKAPRPQNWSEDDERNLRLLILKVSLAADDHSRSRRT